MNCTKRKLCFWVLVALTVSFSGLLEAVSIGSLKDFPVGSLRMSFREGKENASFEMKWGGPTESTGSKGPIVKCSPGRGEASVTEKISKEGLERLFDVVAKLGSGYAVPRSTTADRKNQDGIQIYIGLQSEPVWLSFPANEYSMWNKAAAVWAEVSEILKKETSISLLSAKPIEQQADSPPLPKPGMASIADYTSLNIHVNRVHLSETDYASILVKWNRSSDGKISFTLDYLPRSGDALKATPDPKQIPELFKAMQKLVQDYRYPSHQGSRKVTRTDYINLTLAVSGHPGESTFPFFSKRSSQWGSAEQLWSTLVKLFSQEDQKKIIQ